MADCIAVGTTVSRVFNHTGGFWEPGIVSLVDNQTGEEWEYHSYNGMFCRTKGGVNALLTRAEFVQQRPSMWDSAEFVIRQADKEFVSGEKPIQTTPTSTLSKICNIL